MSNPYLFTLFFVSRRRQQGPLIPYFKALNQGLIPYSGYPNQGLIPLARALI